jgi:hypothetical protein
LLVADKGSDDRIVGFWKVKFVAEGNPDIPDGTPIDDGLAQWHSDGAEIMNSGLRPPVTGNFCLGGLAEERTLQLQAQSLWVRVGCQWGFHWSRENC